MNILDSILNWILNWIIFRPDSMKKWIFKTYRPGLLQHQHYDLQQWMRYNYYDNNCFCSFLLQVWFYFNFMSSFRKKRSDMKILLFWNFSFCDTSQLFFLGPMSLPDSLSLFILKDIWNRLTHWSNWDLIDVSLSVDDAGSKLVQIVVVVVVVVVIDVEVSVEEALVTVTQFGDRLVLIIHIEYNRWLGIPLKTIMRVQSWGNH